MKGTRLYRLWIWFKGRGVAIGLGGLYILVLTGCGIFGADAYGGKSGIQKQTAMGGGTAMSGGDPKTGSAIQATMTLSGNWVKPTSLFQNLASLVMNWPGLQHLFDPVKQYRVNGQVCIKNAGLDPTQGLNLTVQVEYQIGALQFIPMQNTISHINPDHQLQAGETHCYDYSLQFAPLPQAQYRTSAIVAVDNHAGWLPGTGNCPGQNACPFDVRVDTAFALAPDPPGTPTITPTPTATPTFIPLILNSSGPKHSSSPAAPKPAATQPPPPPKDQPAPKPDHHHKHHDGGDGGND